jgi:molybdopterin converting factor small subunit
MPIVKFTSHLQRFFPDIREIEIEGGTVAEVIAALDEHFSGLLGYIVDEQGKLRQHVNIFIGEELIQDRETLNDEVKPDDQIYILQALSGGLF